MKFSFKIAILLLVLSLNISASGQSMVDSLIKTDIDSLLNSGIDTAISFNNFRSGTIPLFEETKANPLGYLFDSSYILYFKGENWTIIKYFTFLQGVVNPPIVLRSKPINTTEDSLLLILRNNLKFILEENFMPYVYEFKKNGIKAYSLEYADHYPICTIEIFAKDYSNKKIIEEFTLDKKFSFPASIPNNIPENINYKYNTSLRLFKFFKAIKVYLKKEDAHLRLKY